MGSFKDEWMGREEYKRDQTLAHELGIDIDDLHNWWDGEIEENTTNDGLVTGITVRFKDGAPDDILKKIGADDNNQVWLDPNELEDPTIQVSDDEGGYE